MKFAERMIVATHSLRNHWTGPVTVGVTDDDCEAVMRRAQDQLDIDVLRVPLAKVRRHSAYLTKTLIPTWTPYEETVFIDGDTVVVGKFDELFATRLALTQFADWQTLGRRMSGRINKWRGKSPAIDRLVDEQLEGSLPAINTGVFGFHHGYAPLGQWNAITQIGAGLHMTDELAMQLLFSELGGDCKVFDDRWNCSPIYGVHRNDVRIWHCHGDKHLRRDEGKKVWLPAFRAACEANVGGIADWAGKYDKRVRQFLAAEAANNEAA